MGDTNKTGEHGEVFSDERWGQSMYVVLPTNAHHWPCYPEFQHDADHVGTFVARRCAFRVVSSTGVVIHDMWTEAHKREAQMFAKSMGGDARVERCDYWCAALFGRVDGNERLAAWWRERGLGEVQ